MTAIDTSKGKKNDQKPLRCNPSKLQETTIKWFKKNGRDFPWRNTTNAFHIFIAEVLLRQTQATRLVKPYLDLIEIYPDAASMAKANLKTLRRWFKPLGLVKRADRLIQSSKIIAKKYNGQVPNELGAIQALPGMGIYSARAVSCLAFGKRVPMVDEGSGRVLRRVLGLNAHGPAYSDSKLLELAHRLLPRGSFREFNLGLIDIAAIYCHWKNPSCVTCPLTEMCAYIL